MKLSLIIGAFCLYIHVCSPKIIPLAGKIVPIHPKPKHGECFYNNAIMCSQAGMKVQYDGEKCVDCTCQGGKMGVMCCSVDPYPKVCHPAMCNIWLNTTSCQYQRERIDKAAVPSGKVRMWQQACILEHYEISDLPDGMDWQPDNDKFKDDKKQTSTKTKG